MMAVTSRRALGDTGESIACEYLARKGYKIVERNYLRPWGEIDIVARRDRNYHFIEVKTISREIGPRSVARESSRMSAEDHIHPAKLKKLARTVELYMAGKKGSPDFQIDVVTVVMDVGTRTARCRLYEQVL